jgi:tetratricopeptide (TPR) repeat protein
MTTAPRRSPLVFLVVVAVLAAVGVGGFLWYRSRSAGLPQPGSTEYEQATRHFHRGLAGLDVGLLEGAIDDFTRAAGVAAGEPAIWANLGLTHLRLGAFDAAIPAVARAAELAPDNAAIAFLQGRLDTSRGERDAGIAHLRRAVDLDPSNVQARTALIEEIENAAGPDADAEAQQLLEAVVTQQPDNVAVIVERARLAAKRGEADLLRESIARIEPFTATWPADVVEQFRAVQQAAQQAPADAALEIAFLRNVLAQVPAFLESRREVMASAELVASPFTEFVRMTVARNTPAESDLAVSFTADVVGNRQAWPWQTLLAMSADGVEPPALFVAGANRIHRTSDLASVFLRFPGVPSLAPPTTAALAAVDWNHDFRQDIVAAGAGGVRLFLQDEAGAFADATEQASATSGTIDVIATGVWTADIEMDGDLDLIVGVRGAAPLLLRNNGNGQWERGSPFAGVTGMRAFVWGDLDEDGDSDVAMVDEAGALHVFANLQAGAFRLAIAPQAATGILALAIADVNADGRLDLVTVDASGVVRTSSQSRTGWIETVWLQSASVAADGPTRLFVADLDNNGALDLVVSSPAGSAAWLADGNQVLAPLATPLVAAAVGQVHAVVDLDGDGQLDLAGIVDGQPVRLTGKGTRGYHFQVVRPRAQSAAGDQRINTFGIGGVVEVRSGQLVQKQVISGPVVHVGLGTSTSVDVTRIVWPNGVPQAEFDPAVDAAITAEQRLKGSCPWIFADDGTGLKFVTDFLWRSPLGLRINAADTAGVTQTEDWVKIAGSQLAPKNGAYDIRISAELWETHFVDHVSLMVVDHPDDVEVFVDERFVPVAPPALTLHATRRPVPVTNVRDHRGTDVTAAVTMRDGQYLSTFARGPYQGIAEEHFVEFDITTPPRADAPAWIVAHGWVYPTDSSINVAIGQGRHVTPQSLALEAQDTSGRWVTVSSDLGFPAGKHKTVLIDLRPVAAAGLADARRLRLRTNLEIYWDAIATAEGVADADLRVTRLAPSVADLRYRGYSQTTASEGRRDLPEVPAYDRIANTTARWRDLSGFYTRFGDVRELLASVEDRYTIMNAGDELRLSFPAPPAAGEGWTRDFVLVGDGWVKDGDYNTSYSKTVLPLPTHNDSNYRAATAEPTLTSDPVYQRHRDDWRRFHTRYVTPDAFVTGLARAPRSHRP